MDHPAAAGASLHVLAADRGRAREARRPKLLRRKPLAIVGLSLTLVWAAVLNVQPVPVPIGVVPSEDGHVIESVGVGSWAWIEGIRPGMTVSYWAEPEVAGQGIEVEIDGMILGVALVQAPPLDLYLLAAFLLAIIALLLLTARLPGSSVAGAAAAGGALLPFGVNLGLPAALPLLLLPLIPAALLVDIPDAHLRRRFDIIAAGTALVLIAVGLALTGVDDAPWRDFWHLPLAVSVLLALIGEAMAFSWRFRQSTAGPLTRRLLGSAIPLLAAGRLEAADAERSHLAVDIHNRLLPQIDGLVVELDGQDPGTDAGNRLRGVASQLRSLMDERQTVGLEVGGLGEALRSYGEQANRYGVELIFTVSMSGQRPPPDVEMAAYRVGQAAIDNALRHAGAEAVSVAVETGADALSLTVADDGVGLDEQAETNARQRGRMGLAQMRARAGAIGGAIEIAGEPGNGTRITFTWRR